MIKSVKINGVEYQVQEGLSVIDNASEELDSITFQIVNSEPINLEPMQKVEILLQNNESIYSMVNTWVDSPATFDSNLKNYIINCISETKKLERVQLPNMTITQPFGVAKRKYSVYLSRIMQMYVNKLFPELAVKPSLTNYLSKIDAIEEQFTTPNAKEYINRILEKANAIVKVENGKIDKFDLSQKGNPIDENKLFFKTSSQAIEDYYNSIRMDVQGVQSEQPTIYKELVGMRADGEAVLTTDNATVLLAHNIDKLEKVICYAKCKYLKDGATNEGIVGFILYGGNHNYIKEKQEYDLLKVSNNLDEKGLDYKRMNLYFTRGSNTIEGLAYNEQTWFPGISGAFPAIINIIVQIGKDNGIAVTTKGLDFRDFKFEVTYSALDDVSFAKDKVAAHNSEIRDNQNTSFIDLDKLAKTEQEKLNRLGNEAMPITARYTSLQDIPQLMDYMGDYILAKRELVFHRDYVEFKGTLYKDYIQKNLYYGVSSKRRTSPLALGSESVTRKELTKYKYKFSYSDKPDSNKKLPRYLLGTYVSNNYYGVVGSPIKSNERAFRPIQLVDVIATGENGTCGRFKLEPDVRKAGKSITINFKFYDNKNVGMRIGEVKETAGGYAQQYVSYTDDNAELTTLNIRIYDKRVYSNLEEYIQHTDEYPSAIVNRGMHHFDIYDETLYRYKDGREILNETLQFDIDSDDGIFITDKGVGYFNIFAPQRNEGDTFYIIPKLKVYISTQNKYNKYNCNQLVANSVDSNDLLEVDYSDFAPYIDDNVINKVLFNRIMLYNKGIDMSNVLSWALADENGNVYIAVNKRDSDAVIPTTIYLNKED